VVWPRQLSSNNENGREPWEFGKMAARAFKECAALTYRPLPNMVSQSSASAAAGLPLVRHLILA
jgi:alpha-glucosidase (family GH31 glycosyl hydrolase)